MKRETRRSTEPEYGESFNGIIRGPGGLSEDTIINEALHADDPATEEQPVLSDEPVLMPSAKKDSVSDSEAETSRPHRSRPANQSAPQRRRKNSRKAIDHKISLRMSMIFLGFMLLISLFLIFVPRSTMSQIERRELTKWPEFSFSNYFEGKFTTGITQFYDDTVPARDSFKNASNNIKTLFGITTAGSAEVIGNIKRVEEQTTPAAEQTTTASTEPETETAAAVEKETEEEEINSSDYHVENYDAIMANGMVVVYQDGHWRGIPMYGGLADTLFCDTVNYIRSAVSDDVNIYVMPVPTTSQFYLPSNYADYSADQNESYKILEEHMNDGIHIFNIIEAMNNHNQENIYLRTDHHWASLGAYYAAREFAREADVPFADLDTYETDSYSGYVGTMYTYTESAYLLNDPEEFVYYKPTNSYTADFYDTAFNYMYTHDIFFDASMFISSAYSTFLGADNMIIKITTDANNGRSLLMIKDSFGNAEVPFLTSSFEKIYIIDQRYFDLNLLSFISYIDVTDILFTHSYFATQGVDAELLQNITFNNGGVAFYDDGPQAELPAADTTAEEAAADPAADELTAEAGADAAYDAGYDDTGYDAGYDAGYYDTGYDAGYDAGYDDTGYDAGYDTGYYDAGYDTGYYDAGYDTGYYDAGYDTGYYDTGYDTGY